VVGPKCLRLGSNSRRANAIKTQQTIRGRIRELKAAGRGFHRGTRARPLIHWHSGVGCSQNSEAGPGGVGKGKLKGAIRQPRRAGNHDGRHCRRRVGGHGDRHSQ